MFKNNIKWFIIGMMFSLAISVGVTSYALTTYQLVKVDYPIIVNGYIRIDLGDLPELNYNGTTYLPLRKIAEAVGKDVIWDSKNKEINIFNKTNEDMKEISSYSTSKIQPTVPNTQKPIYTPSPSTSPKSDYEIKYPLRLYSDESKREYLGLLTTNKYDSESIFNEYGTYGSKYSSKSIYNEFGTYGSEFSMYSPFNSLASNPPLIIDSNNTIVGRLSINKFAEGAVSPYEIYSLLKDLNQ